MVETRDSDVLELMAAMKPRGKVPHSAGVLDSWIDRAEADFGVASSGRVRWLVATTVVAAMLQTVVDESGSRFSLKGGTLLQHVFGLSARATRDLDGIVRGDLDDFLALMDEQFVNGAWGNLEFSRSEIKEVRVPSKLVNPKQFDVSVMLKGRTWRRIQVELSPEEGRAAESQQQLRPPSLEGFGLPTPEALVGLAMEYQTAQKIHAATSPHDPDTGLVNNRPRDLVDLLLIRDLALRTGQPAAAAIKEAVLDIFGARAVEAEALGRPSHLWPASVTVYPHWKADYEAAAAPCGVTLTAFEAAAAVNAWLDEIAAS